MTQAYQVLNPAERTFVPKPWGYEDWIFNDPEANYCQKVLFIKAGHSGSIHMHPIKDEVLTCHDGVLFVELLAGQINTVRQVQGLGNALITDTIRLAPGHAIRIQPGTWHRLSSTIDTHVYESSTVHRDDDVERAETWKAVVGCATSSD